MFVNACLHFSPAVQNFDHFYNFEFLETQLFLKEHNGIKEHNQKVSFFATFMRYEIIQMFLR